MAHLRVADLTDIAHSAYGRELRDVVRLRGGTKKGVYRLALDDGTTGIAYVWRRDEDYWPEHEVDPLFGHTSGRGLFLTAHTALSEAGACVPRLVLVDSDVIVVEDLGGEFLEKLLHTEHGAEAAERLWSDLQAVHARLSPRYGRPSALQPLDAGRRAAKGSQAPARVRPAGSAHRRRTRPSGQRAHDPPRRHRAAHRIRTDPRRAGS